MCVIGICGDSNCFSQGCSKIDTSDLTKSLEKKLIDIPNDSETMSKCIPTGFVELATECSENEPHVQHSAAISVPKPQMRDVNDQPISAHRQVSEDKCHSMEIGMMDDKFQVLDLINEGSFGRVYRGRRMSTGHHVAIKAEDQGTGHEQIMREANLCRKLEGCAGVPQVYWYGMHGSDYNFMVMERLGPNLLELFTECGHKFTLTTVVKITLSLLPTLQYLHEKNIMHRDLSPRNIVIGLSPNQHQIYLIDFGLAKQCTRQGQMMVQSPTRYGGYCRSLVGTPRYASINAHRGGVMGRADDLESLGYVLVYLLKGALPWQDEMTYSVPDGIRYIEHQKLVTTVEELCDGIPDEFATLISYARLLRYYEMPDYKSIQKLFHQLVQQADIDLTAPFDWERSNSGSSDEEEAPRLKRSKPSLPLLQSGSDETIVPFTCSLCSTNAHGRCSST